MPVAHYQQLVAWQKAMDLAAAIHLTTRSFPRDELYGLTSQIRRAAVSVPSNIAEGQGRRSSNEFRQFLYTAMGSLQECETQLLLSERFEYVDADRLAPMLLLSAEVGRVLRGLIGSLPS
jgi:four helix bundle protein